MAGLSTFINEAPLFAVVLSMFVFQLLGRELGGWIHRRVAGQADDPPTGSSDKGFVVSGVLGLLALLIAFTFSLSVSRYEIRRGLVTDEANALGTAEMRAQLLATPEGARLVKGLREYARTRRDYGLANAEQKPPLQKASASQRAALQTTALSALTPVAATPLGPFIGSSINSVLDIGVEREMNIAATVPTRVFGTLILSTVLTALMLGYALTGEKAYHRSATTLLFAMLSLVMLLILDLDRPRGGAIHTDQTAMVQLVEGFPHD